MKLILLPGMDGTGKLFEEFLNFYDGEASVVSFPNEGCQSYEELSSFVNLKLPSESHILFAESFSGGLIPHLLKSKNNNTKGIIFVASFVSCPSPFFVRLAMLLPIKKLSQLPGANIIHRSLFLGWAAKSSTVVKFKSVINSLPSATLKKRLKSIHSLSNLLTEVSSLTCVYIRPANDLLVSKCKANEIAKYFKNYTLRTVSGSHFIIQSSPQALASEVGQAVQHIINKDMLREAAT